MSKPKKNTAVSKFNAATFGILSRYTVLPWENREEYDGLAHAMLEAYTPVGPIEEHLVEEITGIMWRKQRLRLAEAAIYRTELNSKVSNGASDTLVNAALIGKAPRRIPGSTFELAETIGPSEGRELQATAPREYDKVQKALALIEGGADYKTSLAAVPASWRDDFLSEYLGETFTYMEAGDEVEFTYEETPEDLAYYLRNELMPYLTKQTLAHRYSADIAEHIQGASFNPVKLENIGRYETSLDRKLERTLAMLIKMQEIRGDKAGTWKTVASA